MAAEGIAPHSSVSALVSAGLARAEAGLAALLGTPIAIEMDEMTLEPVLGVARLAGPLEAEVVGIYVAFVGDLTGHCLLCLDGDSAAHLAGRLLGDLNASSDLVDSALLESGNITVSGLVNGIADAGGWQIQTQPPALGRDMLGALVHTVLAAASLTADRLLRVQARFRADGEEIHGTLLLLPDADSLHILTSTRGAPS